MPLIEVDITALGARGDGLARHDNRPVYVSFTAPGEHIAARVTGPRGDGLAAELTEVLKPAAGRIQPVCQHFGQCGGCVTQHLNQDANAHWKRGLLVDALSRVGFDASRIRPLIAIPPGTRRRAAFNFIRLKNKTVLGYSERASHTLIDVRECPVLVAPLQALLPLLREALTGLVPSGTKGRTTATQTLSGIDLLIEAPGRLDLVKRERLAALAESADLARVSWGESEEAAEPVARRRAPSVRFGDVLIEPPPGGFLQPSDEGEKAMAALVTAYVGDANAVLDLYSGCGSLTFPLAKRARIQAFEGRKESIEALIQAAHRARLPVTAEQRDLARRPVEGNEFNGFQAVVFDPPHAGAAAQAKAIAASGPPIVVAVSCNPATLARDGRILAEGGYELIEAVPLDQFPWSARLEAIALFKR